MSSWDATGAARGVMARLGLGLCWDVVVVVGLWQLGGGEGGRWHVVVAWLSSVMALLGCVWA